MRFGKAFKLMVLLFPLVVDAQSPTKSPAPSDMPSDIPSDLPSMVPSDIPSDLPSDVPSDVPSDTPSDIPSDTPSDVPSDQPSDVPSDQPSDVPSDQPSDVPSDQPSSLPSDIPSDQPSLVPSDEPSMLPSMIPSDQPSQVPSKEPSRSPSSTPSDQPSQIPSKEPSRSPSSNPTSSIKPSPSPSARPSRSPAYVNCELSGIQIITAGGVQQECNYITRNAKKLCIRGDKYCANNSGNLVTDYSGVCCESCNTYYNDSSCSAVTSAPVASTPVTSAPTVTCKSTTIEVKLNDEVNENGIKIKKYDPSTGKFSIRQFGKGRKVFSEANKTYNFNVGCLETDACYRFIFKDKEKETGVSDGFQSGSGYVKLVYGGDTIRFSTFSDPNRVKKVSKKFGDSCP